MGSYTLTLRYQYPRTECAGNNARLVFEDTRSRYADHPGFELVNDNRFEVHTPADDGGPDYRETHEFAETRN